MALDRAALIEIVVSVAAVVAFVTVLILIGLQFNQSDLAATGGLALVAAIALFILAMAGVGYVLSGVKYGD